MTTARPEVLRCLSHSARGWLSRPRGVPSLATVGRSEDSDLFVPASLRPPVNRQQRRTVLEQDRRAVAGVGLKRGREQLWLLLPCLSTVEGTHDRRPVGRLVHRLGSGVKKQTAQQRTIAKLHNGGRAIVGRGVDDRLGLAPSRTAIGRADEHCPSTSGRHNIERETKLLPTFDRGGASSPPARGRGMPVTR